MQTLAQLNTQFGITGSVSFGTNPQGASVATLTHPEGTAEVALQGAQLLHWTPCHHAPVVWLSPAARYTPGKSLRGGIPVCWPWFGPHPSDGSKPAHGFARNIPWEVIETGRLADATVIGLRLVLSPAEQALWPYAASLSLRVEMGAQLRLTLTTCNTGVQPITLTQALHTYFHISDIIHVSVEGLAGREYIDRVPGRNDARCLQTGSVTINGEVDRIYLDAPCTATIIDQGLRRQIQIHKQGSQTYVVWNPGAEKAAKFGDMAPDAYRQMLCVETTNAWDDARIIPPGGSVSLSSTYQVEAL